VVLIIFPFIGGVFTTLYINDKPVCISQQLYGTKQGFVEKEGVMNMNSPMPMGSGPMGSGEHGQGGHGQGTHTTTTATDRTDSSMIHLTDTTNCQDFATLEVGDVVSVGATYNSTAHSLNRGMHDGFAPVMGIHPVSLDRYTSTRAHIVNNPLRCILPKTLRLHKKNFISRLLHS
jgi:hypothetical protein